MSGRDAGLLGAVLLLVVVAGAVSWLAAARGREAPAVVEPGVWPVLREAVPELRTPPGQRSAAVAPGGSAAASQRYVVVSASTGEPIENADVRLLDGGRVVGRTGADGAVTVRDYGVADLAFSARGYLLTSYSLEQRPPEVQAAGGETHYEVTLEPDRYSIPFALRFVSSDGGAPAAVQFRLQAEVESARFSIMVPFERIGLDASVDDALREKWRAHVLLSGLRGFQVMPHHTGGLSNQRVYEGPAEIAMRFDASGVYHLEAVSSDGEVAQRSVRVTLGQTEPLVIALAPGLTMKGIVSSAAGGPVPEAIIRPLSPRVGVRESRAGAGGEFELGPVPDEPLELEVLHHDYETQRTLPRRPSAPPQAIALQPLVRWEVRGVVRARPGSRPVAGAEVAVVWQPSGHEARVHSGADGWFSCVTTADEAEIVIRAEGFQEYAELVTRPAAPETYELLPSSPAARVDAGLTALLIGEVRGPAGEPRPGTTVRLLPESPPGFAGAPGRRITRGGALSLPSTAVADEQGCFQLECAVGGPARLVPEDGVSEPGDGMSIDVALGTVQAELRLRALR